MHHLPEEVLAQIISYFPVPTAQLVTTVEDYPKGYSGDSYLSYNSFKRTRERRDNRLRAPTLRSIALVSKACRRLAYPLLYGTVELNDAHPDRVPQFLASILQSVSTATLVQHLHTGRRVDPDGPFRRKEDCDQVAAIPSDVLDTACKRLQPLDLSPDLTVALEQGLSAGSVDAMYAALLCVCPKIQLFAAVAGPQFEQSYVSLVFENAAFRPRKSPSPSRLLKELREVHFEHYKHNGQVWIEIFEAIFSLSSLEVLRLHKVDIAGLQDYILSGVQSNVKALHLSGGSATKYPFERLLCACPHLEILEMSWGVDSRVWDIDFARLGESINEYAKGLQELRISSLENHNRMCEMLSTTQEPFLSLKALTLLRVLQANYLILLGGQESRDSDLPMALANLLPEYCLEELVIDDTCGFYSWYIDARLHEVILDSRFDKLKTIGLGELWMTLLSGLIRWL